MVYVNTYAEGLRDGLDDALSKLPEEQKELIDKVTDKICEAIHEKVRYNTEEHLAECIKDDIFHRAAKVAESMLMNALAGDDKEIRNLFGFSDWYMKNLYSGKLPMQWDLINAIAQRNPDIFHDEKIKQQEAQIAELQKEVLRLKNYWAEYEVAEKGDNYIRLERREAV